jgi:hypothetical protein
MKTLLNSILFTGALVIGANGLMAASPTGATGRGPIIKNLMALTTLTQASDTRAGVQQELTKREVKRLTAAAESPEDHSKLARYYIEKADSLDAEAAGYNEAAAAYRNGSFVKNLMAPTTPGRYEHLAKSYRDEANSDRHRAEGHERMAEDAVSTK